MIKNTNAVVLMHTPCIQKLLITDHKRTKEALALSVHSKHYSLVIQYYAWKKKKNYF